MEKMLYARCSKISAQLPVFVVAAKQKFSIRLCGVRRQRNMAKEMSEKYPRKNHHHLLHQGQLFDLDPMIYFVGMRQTGFRHSFAICIDFSSEFVADVHTATPLKSSLIATIPFFFHSSLPSCQPTFEHKSLFQISTEIGIF